MKNSGSRAPGYFSRVLGAAPDGVSPLRKPREAVSTLPTEPISSSWSRPAIAKPVMNPLPATRATPKAEIATPEAPLEIENIKPSVERPRGDEPIREAQTSRHVNVPDIGSQDPSPIPTEHRSSNPSADKIGAAASPNAEPVLGSFLDQIFERTGQRYRDASVNEPAMPAARIAPAAAPEALYPTPVARVSPPSQQQPPTPSIEIGQIEIRLQPPAAPLRSPAAPKAVAQPLTRNRYVHGLRQS